MWEWEGKKIPSFTISAPLFGHQTPLLNRENLWLLEDSPNIGIKQSPENKCASPAFPTFMCCVNTASSVLQGDFTAQMKAEEGCGASNIRRNLPSLYLLIPHWKWISTAAT